MKTIFKHDEIGHPAITLAEFEGILPVSKEWGYKNDGYHYQIYKIDLDVHGVLTCYCDNETKIKKENNENN